METYRVTGMTCAACSARVEKAVIAVPGVTSCAVSLLTNSMTVEGTASREAITAAVKHAGYGIAAPAAPTDLTDTATPALRRRLTVSVVLLLLLMVLTMGHMLGIRLPLDPAVQGVCQLLLSGALLTVNRRFFVNGFKGAIHRAPNMDTLVALGAGAAFLYSSCVLVLLLQARAGGDTAASLTHLHGLYFESAGMIVTLITVGKTLEARSKGRTTDALRGLMALAPQNAVLLKNGTETTVPISAVAVGDIFIVRPGETIPTDGEIIEGGGAVDEAALTGESIPADKHIGDKVAAATHNRSGYLVCRATAVGEDTTLSQIIRLVRNSATGKAPIARTADRVAAVFVPTVMAIAAVTVAVWLLIGQTVGFALARGISVLVISCPCALGLATPVAIMVGSGLAARNGILYKPAAALERAGHIKTVVLDKTGTVTVGEPRLTDTVAVGDAGELLSHAYALEVHSEHPLAGAICRAAEEKGLTPAPVTDFEVLPGNGLRARLDGRELIGGSETYIGGRIAVDRGTENTCRALAEAGKTPLLFAYDGRLLGMIAVADVLRPDSREAVGELHRMGLRVVMLTGDNAATAAAIGNAVGADEVISGVLPDGKEAVLREWEQKAPAAMVGDGINDAPALTAASCGIAIGAGTDIAIDAADVVLMRSRMSDLPAALQIGRATLRNIRENLFWAFFYNTLGIPLAAGVFIPWLGWQLSPMLAAAAMSLSSICVVLNALRLNLFRPFRADEKKGTKTMEKILKVDGMMCPHCEAHVKEALEAVPGVETASADHKSGTVRVTLCGEATEDALRDAIIKAGYRPQ